jgi:hypothetical protein
MDLEISEIRRGERLLIHGNLVGNHLYTNNDGIRLVNLPAKKG